MDDGVEEYHHIYIGDAVLVALLVGVLILGIIVYYIIKATGVVSFGDAYMVGFAYFLIGGAVWFVITGMYVTLDYYGDTEDCSFLMSIIYGAILFLLFVCIIGLGVLTCVTIAATLAVPIYIGKNCRRWKAERVYKKAKNASRVESLESKIRILQEEVISLHGKEEGEHYRGRDCNRPIKGPPLVRGGTAGSGPVKWPLVPEDQQ